MLFWKKVELKSKFSCRSYITGERQVRTALHYACSVEDREKIAMFLIEEEKKRKKDEHEGCERCTLASETPSYNMEDEDGLSPAYHTFSSRIMEMLLDFYDLKVIKERDGQPLLWLCAERGIVTEKVANDVRLEKQLMLTFDGSLSLEKGEFDCDEKKYHIMHFFKYLFFLFKLLKKDMSSPLLNSLNPFMNVLVR